MDIASRAAAARNKQQQSQSSSSGDSDSNTDSNSVVDNDSDGSSSGDDSSSGSSTPRLPFLYAVVLTKIDKAGEKQVRQTEIDVRAGLTACGLNALVPGLDPSSAQAPGLPGLQVPVLKTSSVARMGRDDVWKLLQSVIA